MIRRPPRSTQSRSSAASDVYKRQELLSLHDDVLTEVFISVHAGSELGEFLLGLLVIVEFLSLHDDVLSKIFITVHAGGEKASDTWSTSSVACGGLEETSSGWDSLIV